MSLRTGFVIGILLVVLFFFGWALESHLVHAPDHYERENIAGFNCLVHVAEGGRTLIGCEGLQIPKDDGDR